MNVSKTKLNRARRGAAFLDKQLGRSWRRKIRRRKLDMAKGFYTGGCGCIIAQLNPGEDYYRAVRTVGISDPFGPIAVSRGFYVSGDDFTNDALVKQRVEYAELTEAWKIVLREPVS